ncbi:MAG: ROK family protein [Bacilli bacterium]|nr:ROK family protein [Bacilli bacterium]
MRHIIGISIGGTKTAICYATLGDNNEVLEVVKKQTPTLPFDPDTNMKNIYKAIDEYPQDFDFISVIAGSPMDADNGLILAPSNLRGWHDYPIVNLLKERYKVDSTLLNDADASALAEYIYGVGKGSRNFVYLTVGTGFGAGLILNGQLYSGGCFNAGEIGHLRGSETANGPTRNEKKGSFESLVSGGGMGDYANAFIKDHPNSLLNKYEKISARDVFTEARNGDEFALFIVNQCATKLGEALSIILDLLNPDVVAIGGIYPRGLDLLEKTVLKVAEENSLPINFHHAKILPSELEEKIDDYSSLMGIFKNK